MTKPEIDRRKFIQMAAASGAMTVIPRMEAVSATVEAPPETGIGIVEQSVTLGVNGKMHKIEVDTRATLLDTLREQLQLFGTKKGCDHGQCGACTVHVNGRRINSCLTLAVMHDGDEVTTIEGLAQNGQLHPSMTDFNAAIARLGKFVRQSRSYTKVTQITTMKSANG